MRDPIVLLTRKGEQGESAEHTRGPHGGRRSRDEGMQASNQQTASRPDFLVLTAEVGFPCVSSCFWAAAARNPKPVQVNPTQACTTLQALPPSTPVTAPQVLRMIAIAASTWCQQIGSLGGAAQLRAEGRIELRLNATSSKPVDCARPTDVLHTCGRSGSTTYVSPHTLQTAHRVGQRPAAPSFVRRQRSH
jgi:hypothetical protein